ncbi:hypothetical protein CR513_00180, partial [Mucuna pruriens]
MPTQTKSNPREEVKVNTVRSEKELKKPKRIEKKVTLPKDEAPTEERLLNTTKAKDILALEKKLGLTITHPLDIVEDVLVKVGEFIFLAGFVILEMEEDGKLSSLRLCKKFSFGTHTQLEHLKEFHIKDNRV